MTQPAEPQTQMIYSLSQQQIREILRAAGREGWNTAGQVVAKTELKTDPLRGTTSPVPTGEYTLSITDNQGNSQEIKLAKGGPSMIQEPGQIGPPTPYNESWIVSEAPQALPKPTSTAADTIPGPNNSRWEKVNGVWTQVVAGDETAAATARLGLAADTAKWDEMLRNQAAGRGLMSNKDASDLQLAFQRGEIDRATLNQRIAEFTQKNALDWETERRLGRTADVQAGLTRAQTAGVGVETALNEEKLRQLILAGPEAQRLAVLNNEVTEAQLEAARQKLRAPTVETAPTGAYITTRTPEGVISQTQMNLAYQPKTQAEIAARIGQIQAAANAKEAEVLAKYKDNPEQGLAEFNRWYDANVQSQVGALQAAQEEAQFARAKEQAATRTAALAAAEAAGRGAVDAYRATGLTRVGPGAAEAMNKITAGSTSAPFKALDSSAAFIQGGKDPRDLYTEAVANALKDISPTAAQMTGSAQPNYAALNPSEMLARTRWTPSGGAPVAAPVAAGGGVTGGGTPQPGGTVTRGTLTVPDTDPWANFIRRDAADQALQLQQGPNGQLARAAGVNVNDLMAAAASTGLSPYDYLQMTGEYRPTTGFPEPAPAPVEQAAPVGASVMAPRAVAAAPVRRRAPVTPAVSAPAVAVPPAPTGEAYYPTEVGGPVSMPAPYAPDYGLGTPTYPYEVGGPVETAAPAAPVEYTPPEYQFPGFEGAMNAARAAYRAVPRVQFGPGGWRRPY